MKNLLCFIAATTLSLGFAQAPTPPVGEALPATYAVLWTPEQVAQVVEGAESTIFIAAETFKSQVISEAVHRALTVRGVQVYIITLDTTVLDPDNYVEGLARAGAGVGLNDVVGDTMIIDNFHTLAGPAIGGRLSFTEEGMAQNSFTFDPFQNMRIPVAPNPNSLEGQSNPNDPNAAPPTGMMDPSGLTAFISDPEYTLRFVEGFEQAWGESIPFQLPGEGQ